ncbi:hypothetical protein P4C99_01840 [Pontiellaceae bacterium B1224]|nr:hypothetical protein [Pontiellaceae bacterium B1224]
MKTTKSLGYNIRKISPIGVLIASLWIGSGSAAFAKAIVVNSPSELLPYLDDDNVDVKLAPGTYSISAADVKKGTFTNPIFTFAGINSTYDFTDVTINFSTDLLTAFGKADVYQVQIVGNHNVLKGLTMVDVGSKNDHPTRRATNLVMDGTHNRVEDFHMTVKGSFPYGYGDAFGKGGKTVIPHQKHSAFLIRGNSNHAKDCTIIHRAYGHAIFTQAAHDALIEGCYVEGEVRSTDDMLAEEGTGSPADKVDFETVWGYRLPSGFMMSLQEAGIRAYNAGETWIDGKEIKRGTHNVTVLNCTIKDMRVGVTLTHATGKKYVEGTTSLGCERGFCIGEGDIVSCQGDAVHGPVFGTDYERDKNCNAEITVLPSHGDYNNNQQLAIVIGSGHNLVFRSLEENPNTNLTIDVSGPYDVVRSRDAANKSARNVEIQNLTDYPLVLGSKSSGTKGTSQGKITDQGSKNNVQQIK